jgi:hypothetical protein
MVAHIVLFRPRTSLTSEERAALVDAFARALREIPSIRHSQVGRRVTHGGGYELLMNEDYEYAAILEFDDMSGLHAYLQHPAHKDLGERFFASFEKALMYDYEYLTSLASL